MKRAVSTALPLTRTLILLAAACVASGELLADVQCSPRSFDFGSRGHKESASGTLTLTNSGTKPVTIRQIRPSCGCINVRPLSLLKPIAPGEKVELAVTMSSGRAMGKLDKYIRITPSGRGSSDLVIPVKMQVFQGFSMEPRDFRYDGVCGGEAITKSVDVFLKRRLGEKAAFPLEVTEVRDAGKSPRRNPHFKAQVVDVPGGKRIRLTLQPTHPEGRIWATVHARLDGKPFVIPVAGEMFRWIKVVPKYFNFSRVSQDDPASFTEEVLLESTDKRAFKILSATAKFRMANPPGVQLDLKSVEGKLGETALRHRLRARVIAPESIKEKPQDKDSQLKAQGSFSGQVTLKTDHPHKPEIVLSFFGFFAAPRK